MRLSRIGLYNFKSYAATPERGEVEIDLECKSTVFYGLNGAGKSTIISAINYAIWPFLNRINITQGTEYRTMSRDMIHIGTDNKRERHCEVMVELFDRSNEGERISFDLVKKIQSNSNKSVTPVYIHNRDLQELTAYFYQEYLRDEEDNYKYLNMPVFLCYGTNRTVLKISLPTKKSHAISKRDALERALDNKIDFKSFFEWYRNQEDYEQERKIELKDFTYEDNMLKSVRSVISEMMEDISEVKIKRSPLRMVAVKRGVEYNLEQLSDGEKCTLALLGDLARRIAIANPARENPLEGEGIVMIDEIDLHMHPNWQRKIMWVLKKKFPNIQFIVTTHSPQVIGEVDNSYMLFRLSLGEGNHTVVEKWDSFGKDSSTILRTAMGTAERNTDILRKIQLFDKAMDKGNYSEAQEIISSLEEIIGEDEDVVRRQIQLRLEKK